MPTKWRRYQAGDAMEFNQLVAVVRPTGLGRLSTTQYLEPGDRYIILPPLSEEEERKVSNDYDIQGKIHE
jgi:hypothetical protein